MSSINKKKLESTIIGIVVLLIFVAIAFVLLTSGTVEIVNFFVNPPIEPVLSPLPETGSEQPATSSESSTNLGVISGFIKCGIWPISNVELSADRGNPFMPKPGIERLTGLRDTSTANCLPADQAVLHQQ